MNFLADESVDFPIVAKLRRDGHTVLAIAEMSPSISDDEVLDIANVQVMLLVTGDKDFGELIFRLKRVALGDHGQRKTDFRIALLRPDLQPFRP